MRTFSSLVVALALVGQLAFVFCATPLEPMLCAFTTPMDRTQGDARVPTHAAILFTCSLVWQSDDALTLKGVLKLNGERLLATAPISFEAAPQLIDPPPRWLSL